MATHVVPHLSICEQRLVDREFLREGGDRVKMPVLVISVFLVWADLVGDSQTFNVGKSRQSRESGHGCFSDG